MRMRLATTPRRRKARAATSCAARKTTAPLPRRLARRPSTARAPGAPGRRLAWRTTGRWMRLLTRWSRRARPSSPRTCPCWPPFWRRAWWRACNAATPLWVCPSGRCPLPRRSSPACAPTSWLACDTWPTPTSAACTPSWATRWAWARRCRPSACWRTPALRWTAGRTWWSARSPCCRPGKRSCSAGARPCGWCAHTAATWGSGSACATALCATRRLSTWW